jgi:hypothetical protein
MRVAPGDEEVPPRGSHHAPGPRSEILCPRRLGSRAPIRGPLPLLGLLVSLRRMYQVEVFQYMRLRETSSVVSRPQPNGGAGSRTSKASNPFAPPYTPEGSRARGTASRHGPRFFIFERIQKILARQLQYIAYRPFRKLLPLA